MIFRRFEDRAELDTMLANRIISVLSETIKEKKHALVLFSGGSTPVGLLKRLAAARFDWSSVTAKTFIIGGRQR